ncbi:MAG TPA: metal-dependent phosphohydrolase [Lachnospiraceae bacterium]|nr:metal-dependent phosphohydrolase [Lachnospiraceae bacterium]
MNKERALSAFREYTDRFDTDDIRIRLKISHTYRVADIAERVGEYAGADPAFSWLLGLLHDIGRFEQLKQYGTFLDQRSVDHAELGADILFGQGYIESFPDVPGIDGWRTVAETAVRIHNKLKIPEGLDAETELYCKVLRDADKADIMRVLTEPPYDERNARIIKGSADGSLSPASEEVMDCVRDHRCVPKDIMRTEFEALIGQACMAFELCYEISRSIVYEQGYLDRLLSLEVKDGRMAAQLGVLREEIMKTLKSGQAPGSAHTPLSCRQQQI